MRKPTMKLFTAFCVLVLGLAAAVQAQVCEPAPVGLVSWYAADGNALDSRSRNNGTLQNGAGFTAGHVGQAFNLSGSSQFVDIGLLPQINSDATELTVMGWIRRQNGANNSDGGIIGKWINDSGQPQSFLLILGGGGFNQNVGAFIIRFDDGTQGFLQDDTAIPNDTWTHVAATWRSSDGSLKLYKNGVEEGSTTAGLNRTMRNSAISADIGSWGDSTGVIPNPFFPGQIDEPTVFNRSLSAPEIAAIHAAGTAGKCKPTATVAPSGLVGWWAGDGNANDTAGTNNGTLQNGAGFAIGRVGQAFSLDGINDHISVANNASLNVQTGDFAVEAWVNLQSVGGTNSYSFIAGKDGCGNANIYALGATPSSGAQLRLINSSGADFIAFAGTPLTTNVWHHLVGVRDGTTLKIFVNGVQAGSTAISGTFGSQTFPFTIGERPANGASSCRAFVDGLIDEVSLYNRALTDSEISSIFNAGIGGKLKQAMTPTGLADWDLGISDLGFEKTGHRPTLQSPQVVNTTIGDATITFPTVTAAGTTQQIPLDTSLFPALPSGTHTGLVYDIATTALFTGDPTVCLNVPSFSAPLFANLRVMHFTGGAWQNVTAASNIFPTLCTEPISSFSPFAVAIIAPSAANVSVSGRVLAANGRPISQATVVFTNSNGTSVSAQSNPFGFYRIDGLAAGTTYIVTTANKRFQFETIVVTPFDDLSDFDITASSGGKLRDSP